MRSHLLPSALLAATCAYFAQAIKIESPGKGAVVDPAKGVTVKWSTVSTDPSRAQLVLVNMAAGHTPFSKDLGEVDLSKGSIVVTEKGVPDDEGYQFNFEGVDAGNTGILAQSEQFEVKGGGDADENTSSAASSSASASTSATGKTSATASGSTSASATNTATLTVPTTLTTAVSSATQTGTATTQGSGTATGSSAAATSTAGAPSGNAVQGGSLLALVAGIVAVMA
ncbi:hypothetical protein VTK56DRAFT_5069 [Thermocarpiscus australiensis]